MSIHETLAIVLRISEENISETKTAFLIAQRLPRKKEKQVDLKVDQCKDFIFHLNIEPLGQDQAA